jgi:hypothetical protein
MVPQCIPAKIYRGSTPFKQKKRTRFRVPWKQYLSVLFTYLFAQPVYSVAVI